MHHKPLVGKVAIVTGAGSPIGLGRAMTIALINAGARVAMLDINDIWLTQTANEMRQIGGNDCVLTHVTDVSDPESAEEAVKTTISGLGGLHILINNAGIMSPIESETNKPNFWDVETAVWNKVLEVNSSGPFHMAKASAGHMISQDWGRIIGVTTSIDSMYRPGMCPYGPSKACHEALIALMAIELKHTNVTANVLIPGGTTDTNILPQNIQQDRTTLIRPEIMQAPVVWLSSEEAGSINGQRFIAYNWDETLPIKQRIQKAGAPAAWPQLGYQTINPW